MYPIENRLKGRLSGCERLRAQDSVPPRSVIIWSRIERIIGRMRGRTEQQKVRFAGQNLELHKRDTIQTFGKRGSD